MTNIYKSIVQNTLSSSFIMHLAVGKWHEASKSYPMCKFFVCVFIQHWSTGKREQPTNIFFFFNFNYFSTTTNYHNKSLDKLKCVAVKLEHSQMFSTPHGAVENFPASRRNVGTKWGRYWIVRKLKQRFFKQCSCNRPGKSFKITPCSIFMIKVTTHHNKSLN